MILRNTARGALPRPWGILDVDTSPASPHVDVPRIHSAYSQRAKHQANCRLPVPHDHTFTAHVVLRLGSRQACQPPAPSRFVRHAPEVDSCLRCSAHSQHTQTSSQLPSPCTPSNAPCECCTCRTPTGTCRRQAYQQSGPSQLGRASSWRWSTCLAREPGLALGYGAVPADLVVLADMAHANIVSIWSYRRVVHETTPVKCAVHLASAHIIAGLVHVAGQGWYSRLTRTLVAQQLVGSLALRHIQHLEALICTEFA